MAKKKCFRILRTNKYFFLINAFRKHNEPNLKRRVITKTLIDCLNIPDVEPAVSWRRDPR